MFTWWHHALPASLSDEHPYWIETVAIWVQWFHCHVWETVWVILLEATITRWVHYSHKDMEMCATILRSVMHFKQSVSNKNPKACQKSIPCTTQRLFSILSWQKWSSVVVFCYCSHVLQFLIYFLFKDAFSAHLVCKWLFELLLVSACRKRAILPWPLASTKHLCLEKYQ